MEIVNADVANPVRREILLGFKATVTFVARGERVAFRLTLPVKLFRLASEMVNVANPACGTTADEGFAPTVKSGVFDCPELTA